MRKNISWLLGFFFIATFTKGQEKSVYFTQRYAIFPVNINTEDGEFSPYLSKNKLFFVSNRESSLGLNYTAENNRKTTNIYLCEKIDSINFSKPKSYPLLNTVFDDGPAMLNDKGEYIVYSSSNKNGVLQIFCSEKKSETWTKPIVHPVCQGGFSYCHPFLSSDGKTLFFSANIPGGMGGMDIYYAVFKNSVWSKPVNLGPRANSTSNDIFPCLSKDNKLFFSSKRENGKGGLDIYSFDLADSAKSRAKLLDSPLNSTFDDFGICFDATGKNGYFSSNRNESQSDNIFYFSTLFPELDECLPVKRSSCFTFFKDTYLLADGSVNYEYEWDFGDGKKARSKAVKHCYSKSGFYNVKLNIVDKVGGKIIYCEQEYTIGVRPLGIQIQTQDSLYTNSTVSFDAKGTDIDGYTPLNFNWVLGDSLFCKGKTAQKKYSENGIYRVELGVEAENILTKKIKKFSAYKYVMVGEKSFLEKNLRLFKYAELLPDADSLYFENETNRTIKKGTKTFRYANLKADAFALTGNENGDATLNEQERISSKQNNNSSVEKKSETIKNTSLPPVVDTLFLSKNTDVFYRINLGYSSVRLDKKSKLFEGLTGVEEIAERNGYLYTLGKESSFEKIAQLLNDPKIKFFKKARVAGFGNKGLIKGQFKNLSSILFDSITLINNGKYIYFKVNSADFEGNHTIPLDAFAKNLTENSSSIIVVYTNAPESAANAKPDPLSAKRTIAIVNYLVGKGCNINQIKIATLLHPAKTAKETYQKMSLVLFD